MARSTRFAACVRSSRWRLRRPVRRAAQAVPRSSRALVTVRLVESPARRAGRQDRARPAAADRTSGRTRIDSAPPRGAAQPRGAIGLAAEHAAAAAARSRVRRRGSASTQGSAGRVARDGSQRRGATRHRLGRSARGRRRVRAMARRRQGYGGGVARQVVVPDLSGTGIRCYPVLPVALRVSVLRRGLRLRATTATTRSGYGRYAGLQLLRQRRIRGHWRRRRRIRTRREIAMGSIRLRASPSNAKVYVDGTLIGIGR